MNWNRKYGLPVQEDTVGYIQYNATYVDVKAKYEAYFNHSRHVKSSKAEWMKYIDLEDEQ